jgi:hypothetical protein
MNHPTRNPLEEIEWFGQHDFDFVDLTLEPPAADPDQIDTVALRKALDRHGLGVVAHTAWPSRLLLSAGLKVTTSPLANWFPTWKWNSSANGGPPTFSRFRPAMPHRAAHSSAKKIPSWSMANAAGRHRKVCREPASDEISIGPKKRTLVSPDTRVYHFSRFLRVLDCVTNPANITQLVGGINVVVVSHLYNSYVRVVCAGMR